jgi:prefoldin subunit 5
MGFATGDSQQLERLENQLNRLEARFTTLQSSIDATRRDITHLAMAISEHRRAENA